MANSDESEAVILLSDTDNETDQDLIVTEANVIKTKDYEVALVYPKQGPDSICIYKRDLICLNENEYINDSILGFYLKYIQQELIDAQMAERVYIFSTFFFNKLNKNPDQSKVLNMNAKERKERQDKKKRERDLMDDETYSKMMREKFHNRVRNWTKSVDIFTKDFLFVPIVRKHHWFLAVICYPGNMPEFHDQEQVKVGRNRPCILVFDSLNKSSNKNLITFSLRYFLQREWELKRRGEPRDFSKSIMPEFFPKSPRQPNYYDCGLYVLNFVHQFLIDPSSVLQESSVETNLRLWFPKTDIYGMRQQIVDVLKKLNPELKALDIVEMRKEMMLRSGRKINQNKNRRSKRQKPDSGNSDREMDFLELETDSDSSSSTSRRINTRAQRNRKSKQTVKTLNPRLEERDFDVEQMETNCNTYKPTHTRLTRSTYHLSGGDEFSDEVFSEMVEELPVRSKRRKKLDDSDVESLESQPVHNTEKDTMEKMDPNEAYSTESNNENIPESNLQTTQAS